VDVAVMTPIYGLLATITVPGVAGLITCVSRGGIGRRGSETIVLPVCPLEEQPTDVPMAR
jgi:hypothetical protein